MILKYEADGMINTDRNFKWDENHCIKKCPSTSPRQIAEDWKIIPWGLFKIPAFISPCSAWRTGLVIHQKEKEKKQRRESIKLWCKQALRGTSLSAISPLPHQPQAQIASALKTGIIALCPPNVFIPLWKILNAKHKGGIHSLCTLLWDSTAFWFGQNCWPTLGLVPPAATCAVLF